MTLDELLDKLLFVAVSDDGTYIGTWFDNPVDLLLSIDPTFVSHFLLTYRRFALPRSILLAMQKRMRALDSHLSDPMFACFAQMKSATLLRVAAHTDFCCSGFVGCWITGFIYILPTSPFLGRLEPWQPSSSPSSARRTYSTTGPNSFPSWRRFQLLRINIHHGL